MTGLQGSCIPCLNAKIVHIDIDTAAISKNIQVDIPIVADAKEAIDKMLEHVSEYNAKKWLDQIEEWKRASTHDGAVVLYLTPQDILETINRVFEELIVVTDVGQHQMFTAQFIELTNKKKLLMSGGLGTMGYGLPGAIGAKIGNPDTPVLSISGDGGMQMNIQKSQQLVLRSCLSYPYFTHNLGMVRAVAEAVPAESAARDLSSCRCRMS